ncbi:MAG: CHAT domain-containing protein [Armatimonadetes bacterium]|nr:CHAT domain-containing protein [Armatimonadota bacterium]
MALCTATLLFVVLASAPNQAEPIVLGFARAGNPFERRISDALKNPQTALRDLDAVIREASRSEDTEAQSVAFFWRGSLLAESGQLGDSALEFGEAIRLLANSSNPKLAARSYLGRGVVWHRAGKDQPAIADLSAAAGLWETLKDNRSLAESFLWLAAAESNSSKPGWQATLGRCELLAQSVKDNRILVGASRVKATNSLMRQDWPNCRRFARQGLSRSESGDFWKQDRAECKRLLAWGEFRESPPGHVLDLARDARKDFELAQSDHPFPEVIEKGKGECSYLAAAALVDMRMWDAAKAELANWKLPDFGRRLLVYIAAGTGDIKLALDLLKSGEIPGDPIPVYLETCKILYGQSDYRGLDAVTAFGLRELAGNDSLDARRGRGILLDYSGLAGASEGDYTRAEASFSASIALLMPSDPGGNGVQIPVAGPRSLALMHLGQMYALIGQKSKALAQIPLGLAAAAEAEEDAGKSPDSVAFLPEALFNQGSILLDCGRTEEALKSLDRAATLFQGRDMRLEMLKCEHSRGNALLRLGRTNEAIKALRSSLGRDDDPVSAESRAVRQTNLAQALMESGRTEEARRLLSQALPIVEGSGDVANISLIRLMVGRSLWMGGEKAAAILFGKAALASLQQMKEGTKGIDPKAQTVFIVEMSERFREVARWLCDQNRVPEAEEVLYALKAEQFGSAAGERSSASEKISLTPKESAWMKKFQDLGTPVLAIAREYSDLRAVAEKTEGQRKRLAELEQLLDQASSAFNEFQRGAMAEFGKLKLGEDQALAAIERSKKQAQKLAGLPGRPAIIYPFLTADGVSLIVATPSGSVVKRPAQPLTAQEFNLAVLNFRVCLRLPQADPTPYAKVLYDQLVAPMDAELKAGGIDTLMWMMEGQIQLVPVAALVNPTTGRYLVEEHPLSLLCYKDGDTGRLSEPGSKTWRGASFGVSLDSRVGDETFSALPGVQGELAGFHQLVPGDPPVVDAQFDESSLTGSLVPGTNVLHIATHFQFKRGSINESFLLLGQSKTLTVSALKDKRDGLFSTIDLLVLSACQTAVPERDRAADADGIPFDTVASVAESKGAASVLATLWKVFDKSTSAFMLSFYRLRNEHPELTKAQLIRQSQIDMIEGRITPATGERVSEGGGQRSEGNEEPMPELPKWPSGRPAYSHPYYWAPFVLFGNWR